MPLKIKEDKVMNKIEIEKKESLLWKMLLDNEDDKVDFNMYQKLAQRTSATELKSDKLLNGLMGLNGEAGEAIDYLKKCYFQGHELDKDKLIDELGDVLWYIAEACVGLGIDMEGLARQNIGKLYKRYPKGFEVDKSVNRG